MAKVFKPEVLDKMRSDTDLYTKLCKALPAQPGSLRTIIDRNGRNLNQYSIVTLVAAHLGRAPEDLLEEEMSTVNK